MSNKYWEVEKPEVFQSDKNEVRIFKDHGKIQIYPRIERSASGLGRGATIDLESMTEEELEQLYGMVNSAIKAKLERL